MNFIYFNQHVLDNLFYILVSLLIFFVLYENMNVLRLYKKTLLTACASVPIILCMKFPIYIDDYCIHDLRQIPFLLGILYGGWPVGAALLFILLMARFAIYGFNLITLVIYLFLFITAALFSKKFNKFNRKYKLGSAALFSILLGGMSTAIALLMSDSFRVTEAYVFYFMLIPPFIMFFAVYIIEVLRDAIHLKTKIIKLEKMEVVSQLAASISHEVRNPLTVVKGFIHLLKDPNLSQGVRNGYFQHVTSELDRAETIISDYLAFAKPAIEKVEDIFVDREIRSIIEMIKPLASMSSVEISESIEPATIRGNSQYFKQCFLNLMKNGVEAMPNGGELNILMQADKGKMLIKISDNGVGMTKEQINRFGEPYYSSKEKGTGLGSMVAIRTIQMMNGTLDIKSDQNEGTTITVTFPSVNRDRPLQLDK
ncbi:sensor histidine kinase [Metabacillus niabensis]|uniref:sensor histidine kinase n=1 Tax=Metabacillus niabensis TaxID=324854 RepID=UPI001CFBB194|nr:HAMP domain-containing sensor histidine kinase [Metabacillus niabensis]